MNTDLLHKHIRRFANRAKKEPDRFEKDRAEREDLAAYYHSFTEERILEMGPEDIFEYLSRLWALRIWGNKQYVVDKVLSDNGFQAVREGLANLVWGQAGIEKRWNTFSHDIKGLGPAMTSEILCKTHPDDFMLWNRRAYVGLDYLEVGELPRHNYQLTGAVYERLCRIAKKIAAELKKAGFVDTTLLAVDYFIWDELQVADNLSKIHKKVKAEDQPEDKKVSKVELEFVHNDVKDRLRDIGQWLGFDARTEKKVAEGARVDTVWEATIGNMGRVIYVFEVQTKGSIDSLIVNLLKALNNPAVQGVVAVSDSKQLVRIREHARGVKELRDKLRYWNYEEVLSIHEKLELVSTSITKLDLVPQGF